MHRPIYLQREYGYDQVQISWVYQAFAFGGLCSGLLCARLSRRIWERTLLLSGQVIPDPFTPFGPYLAHFFPVFSRVLRVFTVSSRRFQRAQSRKEWPRNSGKRAKSREGTVAALSPHLEDDVPRHERQHAGLPRVPNTRS